MPRSWLCIIALLLPLGFSLLVLHTDFVNSLWYSQHYDSYGLLNALRAQPMFLQFMGGWPLPAFVATVFCRWMMDEDNDTIPDQLLVLPIVFMPFAIGGDWLVSGAFKVSDLYVYPLVILPVGYAYVIIWTLFIWMLGRLQLVV